MTQEEDDYAGDNSDLSLTVLNFPQCPPGRTRGSSTAGPTVKADRQQPSKSSQHKQHSHSKSASNTRRRPNAPTMSLPKIGDLTLHSASTSQIVGTPFATDSKQPFEYPFPENTHPYFHHSDFSSSSVSATSSAHTSPTLMVGSTLPITPPLGSSTYPIISASTSPMIMPGHHQMGEYPSLTSSSSGSSSTSSSIASSTSSFTCAPMTHPKLKPHTGPPPVPPSLIKKRPRWSLGIIGRRRSSFEGAHGDGQDDDEDYSDAILVSQRDDIMGRGEY